jgi:hypothetical protein
MENREEVGNFDETLTRQHKGFDILTQKNKIYDKEML